MVSKKKLTAGIALFATVAYAVTRLKGSNEPVAPEEDIHVETN
ncbi:hypothetical protein ACFQJ7_16125 [Halovenus rubra]|uniref:Uncharacterized protein n=2 Tax=Halovenus rubra TaxID=869890 RepID=A0ABD5XEA0_9EURY|nr:hypothetical protein [Halovenus rubra]